MLCLPEPILGSARRRKVVLEMTFFGGAAARFPKRRSIWLKRDFGFGFCPPPPPLRGRRRGDDDDDLRVGHDVSSPCMPCSDVIVMSPSSCVGLL